MAASGEHPTEGDTGLERIIFFSDAIFAIAMTLLVIDIKVPEIGTAGAPAAEELTRRLVELTPKFLSYVISFLVIGLYWIAHHRDFRLIKRYDANLIMINLLFLLCIAFLPFPTALFGDYGDQQVALIFYAVSLAITGLLLAGLWLYATSGRRLVDKDLDSRLIAYITLRTLLTPLVFLLSIAISFWNLRIAEYSWVLIAFIRPVLRRVYRVSG